MWAESARGKLPGNVFSSATLWLTPNHPTSISRERRKTYATRKRIYIAYRVSQRGLNFHTLIKLKPSTLSCSFASPFWAQEVTHDSSTRAPWWGEQYSHQGSWRAVQTAIHLWRALDSYCPRYRQREAGIEGYASRGKAARVRRAPGGATCLPALAAPTAAPDSLNPKFSLLMHGAWAKEVGTGLSACYHGMSKCHVSIF